MGSKGEGNMRLEKRKLPRLEFGISILYDGKRGMTKDISRSGTFIRMNETNSRMPLPPIGSEIIFSLDFPTANNYIDLKGTVVHHSKEKGMGIWFEKMEGNMNEFIGNFVLDYSKG